MTSGVTDPALSDYALVYVTRRRPKLKHESFYIIRRSYGNFDSENFKYDISMIPWGVVYEYKDPNVAAEILVNLILCVADKHAPMKKIKGRVNQLKWVTNELLSAVDAKQHWANIHRRRPSQYTAARKREAFRYVAKLKHNLKRNYIIESLEECQGNSKKTLEVTKRTMACKMQQQ